MQNYKLNDIIENEDGDKAKVLAVLGEWFMRSMIGVYDIYGCWYKISEAEQDGWKVVGAVCGKCHK